MESTHRENHFINGYYTEFINAFNLNKHHPSKDSLWTEMKTEARGLQLSDLFKAKANNVREGSKLLFPDFRQMIFK